MSDSAVAALPKVATPKKAAKSKVVKKPVAHPSYQDMIKTAVESLKERNGSSRQAIQKYLQANFKTCDDKTSQAHLKLALKRGVDGGVLKRVKGTGASGSFRMAEKAAAKPKVAAKKPVVKKVAKPAGAKKVVKPKVVKTKTAVVKKPKKIVAEKKATKPKVAKKPKTPKKATKPVAAKKAATPKAKKPAAKKAPAKK